MSYRSSKCGRPLSQRGSSHREGDAFQLSYVGTTWIYYYCLSTRLSRGLMYIAFIQKDSRNKTIFGGKKEKSSQFDSTTALCVLNSTGILKRRKQKARFVGKVSIHPRQTAFLNEHPIRVANSCYGKLVSRTPTERSPAELLGERISKIQMWQTKSSGASGRL